MSDTTANGGKLHLPDLYIKGFGGIKELSISRLGRVTLIAGKNAVGKTTLLDAIRVYAARNEKSVLTDILLSVIKDILKNREEMIDAEDEFGDELISPNWEALFYGRKISEDAVLTIGPKTEKDRQIRIRFANSTEKVLEDQFSDSLLSEGGHFVEVGFKGKSRYFAITDDSISYEKKRGRVGLGTLRLNRLRGINTEWLGPGLPSNESIARFWDKVALTSNELKAVEALNLVFDGIVERVAMIGSEGEEPYGYTRRAAVKISGESHPVPLKSLGEGATRLLSIALALTNSQDGFLLIDEAENGIHHSIQRDFWTMVLKTAQANNVQVLATTHSWDCVVGFAQAAEDVEDVDVALVRLEKDGDDVYAVEYSERNLKAAARSGIEVR